MAIHPLRIIRLLICVLVVLLPAAVQAAETVRLGDVTIGFDGVFKVGHWTPLVVDVVGDRKGESLTIEATTADSDGVPVTTAVPVGDSGPTQLTIRVGRIDGEVAVRLVDAEGNLLDRAQLSAASSTTGMRFRPLPASGELLLQIGPGPLGLERILADEARPDAQPLGESVQLVDIEALPVDWFGYEAVNVVVLLTSDTAFIERLVADSQRLAALRKWLELGGRLVVCAGRNAPELFATDKPLANWVPGRLAELVRLPQTQLIETYAGATDAISTSGAQQNIPLPLLTDIEGRIELFGRTNDLPVIVRASRGMGELTFVAIDLTQAPFAEWTGRKGFLRAVLRPLLPVQDPNKASFKLVSLGYDDLAGALRQRLGSAFAGVRVIGFPLVALLVIGFLLLLGPIDYLFIERWTERPVLAWGTLPLLIVGASLAAALFARAAKQTGAPRLNTAELVDHDLTTGYRRTTAWSTLFSPQAHQFDLTYAAPNGEQQPQTLVSWLGLPGSGLGGMHARGEAIDVTGVGYRQIDDLQSLAGVPLLTAATKSLTALAIELPAADAPPPLAAELTADAEGILRGSLTNRTGRLLKNVCLLHRLWGYELGDLAPGATVAFGVEGAGHRVETVKTIVTRRAGKSAASGAGTFLADRASPRELLHVMMFYQAAGGEAFAGLPNRYQAACDLSHLLSLDRAIVVAQVDGDTGAWTSTAGKPLAPAGDSVTFCRYILSVPN